MNTCTDLYLLSAVACQIAECTPDNNELIIKATSLTALGDMLSVIAAKTVTEDISTSKNSLQTH